MADTLSQPSFLPFSSASTTASQPSILPSFTQNQPVVSCVFCIDGSLRSRIHWKEYGAEYMLSYIRGLQFLHPGALFRLVPVLFTSLPPSVPASLSITRPYPFLDLDQFTLIIPDLLPLRSRSDNPAGPDDLLDYGGNDPAILEALVCAVELLDRSPSSSSAHPRPRNTTKPEPQNTHHKHILIITASDIGPPGPHPTPQKIFEPAADDLPRTVPMFNQMAEYDGLTFHDLCGRFVKDTQGRWIHDKQIGLLERKSIVFGFISIARTPRLLTFTGRHLGPQTFHALRQQSSIMPLHHTHSVIINCLTDINAPSNKRPAALMSTNSGPIPFSPNSHLAGSVTSRNLATNGIQDGSFHPSVKRPRTESGDDHALLAPSSNPFSITVSSAPHPSVSRHAPNSGTMIGFPVVIPPQDQPAQSRETQHLAPFLSSSNPPPLTSAQSDKALNVPDNSLAQGLSFLIGGNKSSPVPQSILDPANHSNSSLAPTFASNRSQSTPGVASVDATPPTDALSQALALLTGPLPSGKSSQALPLPNQQAPSQAPQNLLPACQPHPTSPQKPTQPSPNDSQPLSQYSSSAPNPTQPQQLLQTGSQKSQQIFQPPQIQQKQQQQLQQLQQLQESHKIQTQHTASQRPPTSSAISSQLTPSLLPAASIVPSQQQPPKQQSQLMNLNGPGRSVHPTHKSLMEQAQKRAREQMAAVEEKFKRGELSEDQRQYANRKIASTINELIRAHLMKAQAASQANEPNPNTIPPPALSPPSRSDGPFLWKGRLIWNITMSGSVNNGNEVQTRDVSIPIGVLPTANQLTNEWLRRTVDSWPKIWRVDPIRPTNMPELSAHTQSAQISGTVIHLLPEPPCPSNGGLPNEIIHKQLCERLAKVNTFVVPFDDMGHGVVILYNQSIRGLTGIIFIRTPIPYQIFQPTQQQPGPLPSSSSTSIARPNSRATGSPGLLHQLSNNNNVMSGVANNHNGNSQINPSLQQPSNLGAVAQKQLIQQM
ncbi:hypothetical protein PtA15_13A68 [Puccinia triticina]|uniref:Mediator of RNA polymerase II transcription subunit 25 n=1 Tax=Puccinia triticina TaxID=208348 RepID=A0ABY7D1D5_9BASI|nr:uncharacterized protein PtA15_13A68 [Puccinia triticina]WAQ90669.1 hypothetical protein PtA15_13A68 [Puccinia triticina]